MKPIKNGLKTSFYVQNGNVMVSVLASTLSGNSKEFNIPSSFIWSWYPLCTYYTYCYVQNKDDLVLTCDANAPQHYKNRMKTTKLRFSEFYNPETNEPNVKNNLVYTDNLVIENELKKLGLVTWSESYTPEDVDKNFAKITSTLAIINEDIAKRQKEKLGEEPKCYQDIDYRLASHQEQRLLFLIGSAYTMNRLMFKMTDAKMLSLTGD